MKLISVSDENYAVYLNLVQGYECEFSAITKKQPNADGLFALDTEIQDKVKGFILTIEGVPAGIAAIAEEKPREYEVCEFYIVPCFRQHAWGMRFAHEIWRLFPGKWVIKQIRGAEYASNFWRKAIQTFQQTEFEEDQIDDAYWGLVTRQRFKIR